MAAASNGTPAPKPVRCAIYTRKSTEEGLNQEFNSLDAQRESAEAYILSQKHDGWTLVPTQYSDGGYTGANIERPGVRQLLADIGAGKIDCVVVYKVDRLSRSLIDFSKMMELFEKRGVCFVSVTQQFNTNSSLGRLTLNILLSFAQFEREIISERTRDKQVAARKKGKWTGGHILLGYDLDSRAGRLAVNPEEAERIREMFRLYLEGTPVLEIVQRFDRSGWRNKQWTTQEGVFEQLDSQLRAMGTAEVIRSDDLATCTPTIRFQSRTGRTCDSISTTSGRDAMAVIGPRQCGRPEGPVGRSNL